MRIHARVIVTALLLLLCLPAAAQGLDLGVSLGGVSVGVGTGGVSVGVGTPGGGGVSVGVGTGGVNLDLGGTPDAGGGSAGEITNGWQILSQDEALSAVSAKKIVPLSSILLTLPLFTDGELIDAQLVNVRGFLLYDIKVLEPDGDVSDLYFYARSGIKVATK